MVRLSRFELPAFTFGVCYSILLSYRRMTFSYFTQKHFDMQIKLSIMYSEAMHVLKEGRDMLKKWVLMSTVAIATIVVIMALSELKDDDEEKEEL